MTSERQIEANRRNAMQSTGPRTPEGKAVVRTNAVKHGLTAMVTVLPDEDLGEFIGFERRLLEDLAPEGELEKVLADIIIAALWRLRRVVRIESGMMEECFRWFLARARRRGGEVPDVGLGSVVTVLLEDTDALGRIARYEAPH